MKSVALIRLTDHGRRAFPVSLEEAEQLVKEGKALKHNRGLYEMCAAAPSQAVEKPEEQDKPEADSDPQPTIDNTYDTKVMEPVKRRGRPPKFAKAAG